MEVVEVAMNWIVVVSVGLCLVTGMGLASAAERQAKLQVVDSWDRAVVLEDGTKLWLAEGLVVKHLREGVTVKLSYEERNGKHVVTRIDPAE
jgi:hypothetical protein